MLATPFVGSFDGIRDGLTRFRVGLSFDARFHINIEHPRADRFGIDPLGFDVIQAARPLKPIVGSVQIVDEGDGAHHLLTTAADFVHRHLLDLRLEASPRLISVRLEAADPHLLVSDLSQEDQDDDSEKGIGCSQPR